MNSINKNHRGEINDEVIAIVPAAGKASRLPLIECSKEILPIGFLHGSDQDDIMTKLASGQSLPDKPVCFYLLEKLAHAGIHKGIMIIREDKWDIPKTLGNGAAVNMELAYQMLAIPHGTAYTIDQAWPFVRNNIVAIGFPDILFSPDDAYTIILTTLKNSGADIVLGLFPADRPQKVDMVEIDNDNNVITIDIKPESTHLTLTWGIAVWKPAFSAFLHEFLEHNERQDADPELFIGDVIRAAIKHGMKVKAAQVSDQAYLDIGTPDDLVRAQRFLDQ